jgi:16S rRNA (uracil1498-N3)-methyltransferase
MPKFLISSSQIRGNTVVIRGSDYRHITKSLRLKLGETVTLVDESGMEHCGVITSIEPAQVIAAIVSSQEASTESPLEIILCQGLPKGQKMDTVVEKATELGVSSIVPVITERCDVRATGKLDRWRRIAREASKQSGRYICPEIPEPMHFGDVLTLLTEGVEGIMLYEKSSTSLKELGEKKCSKVLLLVGPEGGFSREEAESAAEKGFNLCGLGHRILRTETAGIVCVALAQYIWGDLSQ